MNRARGSHGLYPVDPKPDGLMVGLRQLAENIRRLFNVSCHGCDRLAQAALTLAAFACIKSARRRESRARSRL